MPVDVTSHRDLRNRLKDVRSAFPGQWEASRHLMGPAEFPAMLTRLRGVIEQSLSPGQLRDDLLKALPLGSSVRPQEFPAEPLKQMTGLPATKALRALCVFFGLADQSHAMSRLHAGLDADLPRWLAVHDNPFDLLLDSEEPSLLDLGAGDLSFVEMLADQYASRIGAMGRTLVIHAVDRIQAGSSLGKTYQAPVERTRLLQAIPALSFRYWHDLDMFALADPNRPRAFLPRYDLVTCWAPANPTFAYEPTRLSPQVIQRDLEATRGSFRQVRVQGERALEVHHQGRALLFPPWKFDVRGPVALLDLLARSGTVAILGAVDNAVFWEILAELVADPHMRPPDLVLNEQTRPRVFGRLYDQLAALPVGSRVRLDELTPLRQDLPHVLTIVPRPSSTWGFRAVEIRRGATFPGLPSSLTARRYSQMTEETPPWFLLVVPHHD